MLIELNTVKFLFRNQPESSLAFLNLPSNAGLLSKKLFLTAEAGVFFEPFDITDYLISSDIQNNSHSKYPR